MIRWIKKRYYQWQLDEWERVRSNCAQALIYVSKLGDQEKAYEFKRNLRRCNLVIHEYKQKLSEVLQS